MLLSRSGVLAIPRASIGPRLHVSRGRDAGATPGRLPRKAGPRALPLVHPLVFYSDCGCLVQGRNRSRGDGDGLIKQIFACGTVAISSCFRRLYGVTVDRSLQFSRFSVLTGLQSSDILLVCGAPLEMTGTMFDK